MHHLCRTMVLSDFQLQFPNFIIISAQWNGFYINSFSLQFANLIMVCYLVFVVLKWLVLNFWSMYFVMVILTCFLKWNFLYCTIFFWYIEHITIFGIYIDSYTLTIKKLYNLEQSINALSLKRITTNTSKINLNSNY